MNSEQTSLSAVDSLSSQNSAPLAIAQLVSLQRAYFDSGATLSLESRLTALRALQSGLKKHETAILRALHEDLGKNPTEAFLTEVGQVYTELSHALKYLPKWVRARKVKTPFSAFPAKSFVCPEPLGLTLVFAPWNYPFQLALLPAIAALAAGNCAIVKPSRQAPATLGILNKLVSEVLAPELCAVVVPEQGTHTALLAEKFDFIFYTGSARVGKIVMDAAARQLTPVCLELGGKSPVIITADADLELAAKRIAWGKALNSGQTCIAPDYVLIDNQVQAEFMKALAAAWQNQLGKEPVKNPDYSRIVSEQAFERLLGLVSADPPPHDRGLLKIAPKAYLVEPEHPLMSAEIFGPLLPVLSYDSLDWALDYVRARDKPLALYLFSNDTQIQTRVLKELSFGGGCINDVIMQNGNMWLPFGGVGASGMGRYHGKAGFDLLSNPKSMLVQGIWPDLPLRYPPYKPGRLALFKRFLR